MTKPPKIGPMTFADIFSAISRGYKSTWDARSYLLRLALVPFLLKIIFYTLAIKYGQADGGQGYLRFMLILLPAIFAEGWMMAHFVRYLVLRQTWPFRASGNLDADMKMLMSRARGVLGGTIVYVLIHLAVAIVMGMLMGLLWPYIPENPQTDPMELPAPLAVGMLALVPLILWGFRLYWIYIPFALGSGDVPKYLSVLKGYATSFSLVGVWLLCITPFALVFQFMTGILSSMGGDSAASFLILVLSVVIDLAKGLVLTAGMTFSLRYFYLRNPV